MENQNGPSQRRPGRVDRERRIVAFMIHEYCKRRHGGQTPCDECTRLREYATKKLAACPFSDNKQSCRACRVHCYGQNERKQIREVMKYMGPRMAYLLPWRFITHLFNA